MKYLSIDRIDGDYAICEDYDGNLVELPVSNLPKGSKETDIIIETGNNKFIIDYEETKKRKIQVIKLIKKLKKNK